MLFLLRLMVYLADRRFDLMIHFPVNLIELNYFGAIRHLTELWMAGFIQDPAYFYEANYGFSFESRSQNFKLVIHFLNPANLSLHSFS